MSYDLQVFQLSVQTRASVSTVIELRTGNKSLRLTCKTVTGTRTPLSSQIELIPRFLATSPVLCE